MGIGVAIGSITVGASVIEKHFTLSRADGGVDSAFSLEPNELNDLVIESERAWLAMSKITYGPTESEKRIRFFDGEYMSLRTSKRESSSRRKIFE